MKDKIRDIFLIILSLNIIFGIVHSLSHLFENRLLTSSFDLLFPPLAQILVPLILIFIFISGRDKNYSITIPVVSINFTLIFLYSTYYHFVAETIDHIHNASNNIFGILFVLSSQLLLCLQLLAILTVLLIKILGITNEDLSSNSKLTLS